MVERCRAGDYPAAVLRLRSGWVIMGERQVLSGYCLLLPDPVVPHLNALPANSLATLTGDLPTGFHWLILPLTPAVTLWGIT